MMAWKGVTVDLLSVARSVFIDVALSYALSVLTYQYRMSTFFKTGVQRALWLSCCDLSATVMSLIRAVKVQG
jgi:hypothetical protein